MGADLGSAVATVRQATILCIDLPYINQNKSLRLKHLRTVGASMWVGGILVYPPRSVLHLCSGRTPTKQDNIKEWLQPSRAKGIVQGPCDLTLG